MLLTTRFAPSPTGYLHQGHALSALWAARLGQRFLLRIEDIDAQRCKPEYTEAIYEDLRWLGLHWQEPVRCQGAHMDDYAAALHKLQARGLLYPCFCTRADIARAAGAPQGEGVSDHGPIYPGTCRQLPAALRCERIERGEAYALRLDLAAALVQVGSALRWHDRGQGWQQAQPELFGDVVLARSLRGVKGAGALMPASYHLCVVHDDALQGVNLVTRGQDLFSATHIHRLLQALLDLPVPDYHHHPLLLDAQGKRLAKRDNAPALRDLRAQGVTAAQILADCQAYLPLLS